LGGWHEPAPVGPHFDLFSLDPLVSLKRVTETHDKKQAVLVVAFRGTTLLDQDRYPLELLQESCSRPRFTLFIRIREQLGLAYYVAHRISSA